jgi:hypothetical protein
MHDEWTKLFACSAIVLGSYYISAGVEKDVAFAKRTIWGRPLVFGLMVLSKTRKGLLMLGVVDVLGAVWTLHALLKWERGSKEGKG